MALCSVNMQIGTLFICVILTCFSAVFCASTHRPNIVFILADDYGYYDIGYHGSQIHTPNLNKICSEGVRLENYYVQPICVPSRSQLMSGMYQIHTGLQHGNQPLLPLTIPTVADKIKEAGYATHMVGKWHLGFAKKENMPCYRGFDTMFSFLDGHETYYQHDRKYHGKGPYLDLRTEKGPAYNFNGTYSAKMYTERAAEVLRAHASHQLERTIKGQEATPLFMYLAYQSVHTPLDVPESYMEPYKNITDKHRRKYAGMVAVMDEGIGNLTQVLRSTGMWNNTVLIFSTDNGGHTGEGGACNWPLRGKKGTLWEGGMHGNGFVTGGAINRSGVTSTELIHISDWFPTLVGLARGNLNGTKLDGFDQWQTINGGAASPRKVILHNIDILYGRKGKPLHNDTFDTTIRAAIRVGDYKLITGDPGEGEWTPPPGGNLVTEALQDQKFGAKEDETPSRLEDSSISNLEGAKKDTQNVWLFNIKDDPLEKNDLSKDKPELVKELLDELLEFNKTAVAPTVVKDDPRQDPALHGNVWGPWLD